MKLPERAIVKVSACGIFTEPTFKSEMVNQALIDEEVLISNKKDSWYKIELKHDKYIGWIHEMYLTFDKNNIEDYQGYFRDEYKERFLGNPIINKAFKMLGKPYLWGGRSFQGYDCSGFVQACIKSLGVSFPRDARDQVNSTLLYEIDFKDISTGDLLFFEEENLVTHVAINIDIEKAITHQLYCHNKTSAYIGSIIHSYGSVKISVIIFDNQSYGVVDHNPEKKIKLYKIMRLKENE